MGFLEVYFNNTLERPDMNLGKGIEFKASPNPGLKFNPLLNNRDQRINNIFSDDSSPIRG